MCVCVRACICCQVCVCIHSYMFVCFSYVFHLTSYFYYYGLPFAFNNHVVTLFFFDFFSFAFSHQFSSNAHTHKEPPANMYVCVFVCVSIIKYMIFMASAFNIPYIFRFEAIWLGKETKPNVNNTKIRRRQFYSCVNKKNNSTNARFA